MHIDLSYLAYPLPNDIEACYVSGHFEEMRRLISLRTADPKTPEALKRRLNYLLLCAEEHVLNYTDSRDALLSQLREKIPDFSEEELQPLIDDRTLDWRLIGGEVRYIDSAVDTLLKTRSDYAARCTDPEYHVDPAESHQNQAKMIAAMKKDGKAKIRFTLQETFKVHSDAISEGERVRIWLPLPVSGFQVSDVNLNSFSDAPTYIAPDNAGQRTALVEVPYREGLSVSAEFSWTVTAPYADPQPEKVILDEHSEDLEQLEPHIVFSPYLRALAAEIKGTETNPLIIARRIYDFLTTKATYRFMPPYLVLPCIPEYYTSNLRGDCGVQALTFITLCRICGIPARWQSGVYTEPGDVGIHDWAQYYVAPYGWLYCDCSMGGSAYRRGDLTAWNFFSANLDPWRLPFATDYQQHFDPPMQYARHDPYDNQKGEAELTTRRLASTEFSSVRKLLNWERL